MSNYGGNHHSLARAMAAASSSLGDDSTDGEYDYLFKREMGLVVKVAPGPVGLWLWSLAGVLALCTRASSVLCAAQWS
jgi:hypothetical protein